MPVFILSAIHSGSVRLFKLWSKVYNEPEWSDVVIFNEQPNSCPGIHTDPVCRKRICESCRTNRLIHYINAAKYTIDLAHLTFSHRAIYVAVVAAHDRGIRIRIVTDSQMLSVRGSVIHRLWSLGVPVHTAPARTMMHHKFVIFDGQQRIIELEREQKKAFTGLWGCRSLVMTGSLNWTKQGTASNYENAIICSNQKSIELYQQAFEELWRNFNPMSSDDVTYEDLRVNNFGKNLY